MKDIIETTMAGAALFAIAAFALLYCLRWPIVMLMAVYICVTLGK